MMSYLRFLLGFAILCAVGGAMAAVLLTNSFVSDSYKLVTIFLVVILASNMLVQLLTVE